MSFPEFLSFSVLLNLPDSCGWLNYSLQSGTGQIWNINKHPFETVVSGTFKLCCDNLVSHIRLRGGEILHLGCLLLAWGSVEDKAVYNQRTGHCDHG